MEKKIEGGVLRTKKPNELEHLDRRVARKRARIERLKAAMARSQRFLDSLLRKRDAAVAAEKARMAHSKKTKVDAPEVEKPNASQLQRLERRVARKRARIEKLKAAMARSQGFLESLVGKREAAVDSAATSRPPETGIATRRSVTWHEKDFERWFESDPRLPDGKRLLIVGRHQAIRRMVDLIALDQDGGIVILEVKNESTNRKAIGQALEYLSQYDELLLDELADEYEESGMGDLRADFKARFGGEIGQITAGRRVYLVAPAHDPYSAVCTGYLSGHLKNGIGFHLLTARQANHSFLVQEFTCPPFKRMGGLPKGFALSPRGRRLFYVIDPGSPPIVWNIGRWRVPESTLAFRAKPSRRLLRPFRSHLLPIDPPPQVDLSSAGSVWRHASKRGREATLIGRVTLGEPSGKATAYVAFAEFRNGEFGTFRRRPAQEFHDHWKRTDAPPRPWREIAQLARARLV
jgi:hypothetical protein